MAAVKAILYLGQHQHVSLHFPQLLSHFGAIRHKELCIMLMVTCDLRDNRHREGRALLWALFNYVHLLVHRATTFEYKARLSASSAVL